MLGYSVNQTLAMANRCSRNTVATIAYDGSEQTYSQMYSRVTACASGLNNTLKVGKGDVAAILALNSVEYLEYFFVCPWAGLIASPVNIRLAPPEIAETLNDCSCLILFIDDTFLPMLPALRKAVGSLKHIVYIGTKDAPEGTVGYNDLVKNGTDKHVASGVSGDDVYGIFYTGGTTGKSKGVMLTHTNVMCNAYCVLSELQYKRNDRYLHCAPMFHAADQASSFSVTMAAATHVFMPKFVPEDTLVVIAKRQVTHSLLVPTMFAMVLALETLNDHDVSSCKCFLYGASPMPESVLLKAMATFKNASFIQGYGMTECAPVNTFLSAQDHIDKKNLTSAGRPVAHAECKIVDENDVEVPPGTTGELIVRGPHVMKGYYNMPEVTAHALKNGWMHTGDGASMDEEGYIFIKDRIKDMIVTGGENVYSTEVENCIVKMEKVGTCAVIGIPDDKLVEKVAAIIVPKDESLTADEVMAFCKSQIAGYKCPREVVFRKEPLPLSGAGKVLKNELRKPFWKDKKAHIYSDDVGRKSEYQ